MKNKCIHFKDELHVQCFILIKLGRQHEAQRIISECTAVCSTKEEEREREREPFPKEEAELILLILSRIFWVSLENSFQPLSAVTALLTLVQRSEQVLLRGALDWQGCYCSLHTDKTHWSVSISPLLSPASAFH